MVLQRSEEEEEEDDEDEDEETEPMHQSPKRPKPLHNFTLPFLKWGTQRYLRCSKEAITDPAAAGISTSSGNRHSSRSNSNESTPIPNPPSSSERRVVIDEEEQGIAVVRENRMRNVITAGDRMKDAISREDTETVKSWNLRTRRRKIKSPVKSPVNTTVPVKRELLPPLRIDGGGGSGNVSSRLRSNNINSDKTERPKFSVQLSRKEIEEDFMTIVGRPLPRRPTKRPKNVQKQLNKCFPGLWLRDVTPEMYEVDEKENGKSCKRKGK